MWRCAMTIHELATMSGYSAATISRVLNNKPNVNPETRAAVEKLLIESGYGANIYDFRQNNLNQKTVMIVVGDLHNWYYIRMVELLTDLLKEKEFDTVIGYTGNRVEDELRCIDRAFVNHYYGMIFLNVCGKEKTASRLEERHIAAVFLNRAIPFANYDTVLIDNYEGSYLITKYLIQMGHRRIAHLTGSPYSNTTRERTRGFQDAMASGKLSITENTVFIGDLKYASGHTFGDLLIQKGFDFTAVLCDNDLMAEGLYDSVTGGGLRIPEDLSIVCFDETPHSSRCGLTTVSVEPVRMCRKAAELLFQRVNRPESDIEHILHKPTVIYRKSVKVVSDRNFGECMA